MSSNKYWKGVEELEQTQEFVSSNANEFSEGLPLEKVFSNDDATRANRRDFLKYFGFGLGAVTLAACNKASVKKAIPYTEKPDNVTAGVPLYYASSSVSNSEGFPVLVKVREGRPIKFEPNKEAKFFGGGLDGLGHSAILSLYDTNRLAGPLNGGTKSTWGDFDKKVVSALTKANAKGIAIITNGSTSLVTNQAIADFKAKYTNTEVVAYEPISYSGIMRANTTSFGKTIIPSYNFEKADVVVSFGADFLGTWISPIKFHSDYGKNRVPKNGIMSKHYQFESLMSITGANADIRVPIKMSNVGQHLIALYRELGGATAENGMETAGNSIKQAAADLTNAAGKSLVICGSNNEEDQQIVNAINIILNSYGNTIDTTNYYKGQNADEADFNAFLSKAKSGGYGAVVTLDCNPMYSNKGAAAAFAKIPVRISTAITRDETSLEATHVATGLHPLESWDIKEPYKGRFVFSQPTISPVFDGRQASSSLLAWTGANVGEDKNELSHAYNYTKEVYNATIGGNFNKAIEKGVVENPSMDSVPSLIVTTSDSITKIAGRKKADSELILYQKVGVRDGAYGNTPWAHEMPDPVSKVTWDNYLSVSMPDAKANGWKDGEVMKVTTSTGSVEIPVLVQPGQTKGTYGIALGYGRVLPESVKNDLKDLGKNVYSMIASKAGYNAHTINGVTIEKTADRLYEFGITQTHYSIEGRDIIREASLDAFRKDPKAGQHFHKPKPITLWKEYDYSKGHHWGMAIDLNSCTGCSACIVSCSIENNVPIVGREEVRRRREMHWLRIDRYYSFEAPVAKDLEMSIVHGGDQTVAKGEYMTQEKVMDAYSDKSEADTAFDYYQNVKVTHQPMMCQHCDNAPCETVCPVLATTHSSEGLNQMTYNRCIGTKYCGNNCPYKVRRFNWFRYNENEKFDYHFSNDLGKMVINPDVTVRSRGVMEKCSFCVQRIQTTKLTAKRENRKMTTDEFTVACAQTCPSNAIVFGDLNDKDSEISKLYKDDRSYHVIEEIGTKPSVQYLTKIRNKQESTNHNAH